MSKHPWTFWLILASIALSGIGGLISGIAWSHANAQKREGRILVAQSDLDLCQSIYNSIAADTKADLKNANVRYVLRFLPSLTAQQAANLVAESRTHLNAKLARFDPKHCSELPSQKLKP